MIQARNLELCRLVTRIPIMQRLITVILVDFILACFILACFLAIPALADGPLPVVFQEDFEHGADRWQPQDPAQFEVKKTDTGHVYSQFKKQSAYKPPH